MNNQDLERIDKLLETAVLAILATTALTFATAITLMLYIAIK